MPGPVPHPGIQKQQFTKNVGLFLGVLGRPSLPHPAELGGPGAPGPELKIYIFNYCQRAATIIYSYIEEVGPEIVGPGGLSGLLLLVPGKAVSKGPYLTIRPFEKGGWDSG